MSSRPEEVGYDLARFAAGALEDRARILRARLRELGVRYEPVTIHRTRVAARRLREALALAALVEPSLSPTLSRRARRIVRALSKTRTYDSLAAVATMLGLPAGLDEARNALLSYLAQRRKRALQKAIPVLARRKLHRLPKKARDLARTLCEAPPQETQDQARFFSVSAELIGPRLRKLTAQAALAASASPDDLHEGRILVKKLRYAWELLRPALSPSAFGEIKRPLEEAQDLGGQYHDLDLLRAATARASAQHKGERASFEHLLGLIDAQREDRRHRFQLALSALNGEFERRVFAILDPARP
jgi:CHAD domain-containing protein